MNFFNRNVEQPLPEPEVNTEVLAAIKRIQEAIRSGEINSGKVLIDVVTAYDGRDAYSSAYYGRAYVPSPLKIRTKKQALELRVKSHKQNLESAKKLMVESSAELLKMKKEIKELEADLAKTEKR